jgi:tripartite-type tricarboxylate transporter receptor subunit TctC
MQFSRRTVLRLGSLSVALGATAWPPFVRDGFAQAYPDRPVRIVVGFAAGGTGDVLTRLIGQWLSERLGQPFVVDNRPGGGGNISTEAVVRAPPDGATLLQVGTSHAVNTTLYDKLSFDLIRDIAPVAGIARAHLVMLVHPSFPAKTVPDFIVYAKANPGKINMASAGSGSSPRLAGELLKLMTGIDMVHVPYRGGAPALSDLIAGQVQVMFSNFPAAEYIRAGKLRALAVTTAARSDELPDVPTVAEFVPGYEASAWYGIGAPKGTPANIIGLLNREINTALADPSIKARIADFGGVPIVMTPTEFGRLIADETEKWGKVIKAAGIKPE